MGIESSRPVGPHVIMLVETGGGRKCDCSEPKIDMTAPMPTLLADAGIHKGDYMAMLNDVNVVIRKFSPNVKLIYGTVIVLLLLGQLPSFVKPSDASVSMRLLFSSVLAPILILILLVRYIWQLKRKAEMVRRELSKHKFRNVTMEYCAPTKHALGGVMVIIDTEPSQEGLLLGDGGTTKQDPYETFN